MFAVSEPLIRYAAEVKPYSADLLISLVLLSLAVTWRNPSKRGRWILAAVAPLAIAASLPSVFVIGTIAVVGLYEVLARWRTKLVFAYGGFLVAAGPAIATMAALGQYHTSPGDRAYFLRFWAEAFPPSWHDMTALVGWLLRTHTGPLFAYPHGGNRLSWLTVSIFGCFIVGIVVRSRRDPYIVTLFVLPFVLALAAAALRRYPYGVSVRVAQFLAPATLLMAAAGASSLCARRGATSIPGALDCAGISTCPIRHGTLAARWRPRAPLPYAVGSYYPRVRAWFWGELAVDAELVCVQTDLGIPFRSDRWAYDGGDQYFCFQRIYSRRHWQEMPPRWDAVSATRPLRCVLLNRMPADVPAFRNWIENHRDHYTLREVRTYPATHGSKVEPALIYVVCEFVPTSPQLVPSWPSIDRRVTHRKPTPEDNATPVAANSLRDLTTGLVITQ